MFSERTNWPPGHQALLEAAARLRAAGRPVLDLTETNPTRCGFRYLAEAPESALAQPAARAYAPDPCGLPEARAAIAGYYREAGVTLDPGRLVLTAGTSEGYGHLMRLLCNPGDSLLVPSPSYPLLDVLAQLHDIRLVQYPLHYDDRWWLDVGALRVAAADPACRGIVVIDPNNPTGSVLNATERETIVALAAERKLAVIADEVFSDFGWHGQPSFAAESRALTFTLNGVSKMLGLPQMKLAWIAVNGPPPLVADACHRLAIIADTFLSVNIPAQLALPVWLARRETTQLEIRARIAENLAVARALKHARCLNGEGGWCVVLRVPRTQADEAFALALLERDGVLVDPGGFYGFAGEGFFVVSLLVPPDVFAEGLRRLEARLAGA